MNLIARVTGGRFGVAELLVLAAFVALLAAIVAPSVTRIRARSAAVGSLRMMHEAAVYAGAPADADAQPSFQFVSAARGELR